MFLPRPDLLTELSSCDGAEAFAPSTTEDTPAFPEDEALGLIALSCTVISFATRLMLRRIVEYQWFLIALSVLPGSSLAISAHLLPNFFCASNIIRSSSGVHLYGDGSQVLTISFRE